MHAHFDKIIRVLKMIATVHISQHAVIDIPSSHGRLAAPSAQSESALPIDRRRAPALSAPVERIACVQGTDSFTS